MKNVKDILDVINLDDLNAYNAEQVEQGLPPLTIRQAYEEVNDLINGHAEDLRETVVEKAYEDIDRFISDNYRCYEGNTLEYADNADLVFSIAATAKKTLF